MNRIILSALATLAMMAPAAMAQQTAPIAECATDTGRCVVSAQLRTDAGELFGTLGLQIGRDGSDPVAFALTPLGIATRPGVRIVTDNNGELSLGVDACFPDGCRATLVLSPEQLAQLTATSDMSLQFFPFGADKALSGDVTDANLAKALRDAGVTLP